MMVGAAVGTLGLASPAAASGFTVARFGGEHGHPASPNPTSVYYNPAGMALSKGTHILIDANLAGRFVTYERPIEAVSPGTAPSSETYAPGANAGTAELSNFIASPALFVTSDFGTDFIYGGLGLYFPFGGQATWKANEQYEGDSQFPGAGAGVQRWHTMDGTVRSMYITGALAFDIKKAGLTLGISGSAIKSEFDTIRARNGDGSDDLVASYDSSTGDLGDIKEGRAWLQVEGWQYGIAAGLTWDISKLYGKDESLIFGLSYTSQPNITGGMRLKGTLSTVLAALDPDSKDVEFEQTLPDIIRFGFRYKPSDKYELRVFGDYQRWSVMDKQCVLEVGADCTIEGEDSSLSAKEQRDAIFDNPGAYGADSVGGNVIQNIPRYWKDGGGARIGVSYWFLEPLETYFGLGYDSSAVPDQTLDASLLDLEKVTVSLGAKWQATKWFALAATSTQVIYFSKDTNGQSIFNEVNGASKQPSADGRYSQFITVGNLYTEFMF